MLHDDEPFLCSLVTPRTLLVPGEAFHAGTQECYLRMAGLAPHSDETVVYSNPDAPQVAVMAVARTCHTVLVERFGDRLTYTSPLLLLPVRAGSHTALHQADDTLYVCSYGPELRYAAALVAPTEADVLAHMLDLASALPLSEHPLYLTGDGVRETACLLRRYFRHVVCAS